MKPHVIRYIRKARCPVAVVCGLGLNGLGVVRSLGREKIPVIGIDPSRRPVGSFSRYCASLPCPEPEEQPQCVEFLVELGRALKSGSPSKGVLIATDDAFVALIAQCWDLLSESFELTMPQYRIVEKLFNKRTFYKVLQDLNLPRPRTLFPENLDEVRRLAKRVDYPYIVKPVFSGPFGEEFGVKVFRAESESELIAGYEKATANGHEVVVQEMIPGSDENTHLVAACFNRSSEVLGALTFRRIRQYPRVFGNGALCVSTWQPELIELCDSLVRSVGYYGIIDAELKYDRRDGLFKFLEANPRTGWQNLLVARCGLNLPVVAYRDALGENAKVGMCRREGVKWLYFRNDLKAALDEGLSFSEYLRSLRGKRVHAISARDDPLPFGVVMLGHVAARLRMLFDRGR